MPKSRGCTFAASAYAKTGMTSKTIHLPASKSLANRALIIQALSPTDSVHLTDVSEAKDTQTLVELLGRVADGATLNVGPAGTTFRFLTAFLCTRPGRQTLTGSERMLQRPCAPLVNGLRQLGAEIEYLGEEGYPPLRIGALDNTAGAETTLAGDISSQFLSAILMIGPVLPKGLTLHWTGELVSRPYLEMTVKLMQHFGATIGIEAQSVTVDTQPYTGGQYAVESDWSAASYAAAWTAIQPVGTVAFCPKLYENSLQGDHVTAEIIAEWGVEAAFEDTGVRFRKTRDEAPQLWEYNFEACPDLAQTFSVLCAVTGTTALMTGLQTLSIKETDRIAALKTELEKVGVSLAKLPPKFTPGMTGTHYMQEGEVKWDGEVEIATYHDHRMAMAFALLRARGKVSFEDESVVVKSWPSFWEEMGY